MNENSVEVMRSIGEALENKSKVILSAYKKFKSNVYFDKTRIHVAKRIVKYESALRSNALYGAETHLPFMQLLEQDLTSIMTALTQRGSKDWKALVNEIIDSIEALPFPKETISCFEEALELESKSTATSSSKAGSIIRILDPAKAAPVVKKVQTMIDMNIRGFILGVLWVMLIGVRIDQEFGEWVYGNRLRKAVRDNPPLAFTMSPYLFQPYFSQYESWRDKALRVAESIVDDGDEAILFMTDLKSFYYSVDFRETDLRSMCECIATLEDDGEASSNADCLKARRVVNRLNGFVLAVIERYSEKFYGSSERKDRNLLPIGFEPSCILSNWSLSKFDREIVDKICPAFYGRYVDDIIVVERIPEGGLLSGQLNAEDLTVNQSIKVLFGLSDDSRFCKGKNKDRDGNNKDLECPKYDLLQPSSAKDCSEDTSESDSSCCDTYEINSEFLNCPASHIKLQVSKTKLIAISPGVQRPLLEHFKSTIARNSSAFNLMPNIDDMDIDSVFDDIFEIDAAASPNKLRDLRELKLNSFELSKYLGKCQRILPLVESSKIAKFAEQILNLFTHQDLISFYTTWEKLFEILLFSGQVEVAARLYRNIKQAIDRMRPGRELQPPYPSCVSEGDCSRIQSALCGYLDGILAKVTALMDGDSKASFKKLIRRKSSAGISAQDAEMQDAEAFWMVATRYLDANMVDKYAMPIPSVMTNALSSLSRKDGQKDTDFADDALEEISLTDITCVMQMLSKAADDILPDAESEKAVERLMGRIADTISPLPYMLKIQDIQFFLSCLCISCGRDSFDLVESSKNLYGYVNYFTPSLADCIGEGVFAEGDGEGDFPIEVIECNSSPGGSGFGGSTAGAIAHNVVGVDRTRRFASGAVKVAVANICLPDSILDDAIKERKPRFRDYQAIERLTRESKREGANLIVLPELSVPFAWIPRLMAFSANEGIAIVCGVRYVLGGSNRDRVYNLTATILPFSLKTSVGSYRYANLLLHNKVFFPPSEVNSINNYQKAPVVGRSFDLFVWRDFWFPVYCCFELASPFERISFSSLADALVAVEWNPDVGFYDNVISALARDMSCYCIQANNSRYGDSRIEQPKKTTERTMLRVSGGMNWSIIVGSLDLEGLRNCQLKDDGGRDFKPPAPDYAHHHAKLRLDGELWKYLKKKNQG